MWECEWSEWRALNWRESFPGGEIKQMKSLLCHVGKHHWGHQSISELVKINLHENISYTKTNLSAKLISKNTPSWRISFANQETLIYKNEDILNQFKFGKENHIIFILGWTVSQNFVYKRAHSNMEKTYSLLYKERYFVTTLYDIKTILFSWSFFSLCTMWGMLSQHH